MALYKYLSPDRLAVLENGMLRFTPAVALNDPFEAQAYFERIVPEGWLGEEVEARTRHLTWDYVLSDEHLRIVHERHMTAEQRAQLPFEALRAQIRGMSAADMREASAMVNAALGSMLGAAGRDLTAYAPRAREQLGTGFRTRFGILCLSGTPLAELMWSHYADSYRGFAVGFDERHPWFDRRRTAEDEFYQIRPVMYVGARAAHDTMLELNADVVFWTKNDPWAYEQEWRMVVPLEVPDRQPDRIIGEGEAAVHLFAFPADAVQEVVLGCRAPAALRTRLEELLSEPRYAHVQLVRAVLDERRSTLSIDRTTEA